MKGLLLALLLLLWSVSPGHAAPGKVFVNSLVVTSYEDTWAAVAQWSGKIGSNLDYTLLPTIAIPGNTTMLSVLGGYSDNAEAILTFACTGLNDEAKTYTTATYGLALRSWAFPAGATCWVEINNPSSASVSASFLLSMVRRAGAS